MKFNLFGKKITAKTTGKTFIKYVTTLTKKDGTEVYTEVKVPDEEKSKITTLPCVVTVDKNEANFTHKTVVVGGDEGTEAKTYDRNTLWVKKIAKVEPYVDHSLDDFD